MELLAVFAASALVLGLAYRWYGNFLMAWLEPDERRTPAHELYDGNDFVPASVPVVTGQHFSAIAAAGPIVGPILAGLYFGWVPALLWIVFGAILVGGVHDMASLFASIRHRAASIAQVARERMSRAAYGVFLVFIWLSLVYVIIAFTDLTAASFSKDTTFVLNESGGTVTLVGGGIATSAATFLALSVILGMVWRFARWPLWLTGAVAGVLVGSAIWWGQRAPLELPGWMGGTSAWVHLLLVYCLVASVTPMWVLLQPRGFLGSLFLYVTLFGGVLGLVWGGLNAEFSVAFPAFVSWNAAPGPLFPFLFITVACGACSGFHSIVASGTTSKQLNRETDIKPVAYGAMLLEAMVAVLALGTVMILAQAPTRVTPDAIFAQGIGRFFAVLGVPMEFAIAFGLLAFNTFIFDTLDVCTRLGRYVFQELTGWSGRVAGLVATLATLAFPAVYLAVAPAGAWREFWTIFGTSNQLLAALTLVGVSVWLKSMGRSPWPALIPAGFMLAVTGTALAYNIQRYGALMGSPEAAAATTMNFGIAVILAGLGLFVSLEAFRVLRQRAVGVGGLEAQEAGGS